MAKNHQPERRGSHGPHGRPHGERRGGGIFEEGGVEKQIAAKQRKLIPLNIVVMVLALVAGFTLIFAPLISIDLGKMTAGMMDEIGDMANEEGGEESEMPDFTEMLGDLKLSLSTYSLAQFALAKDPLDGLADQVAGLLAGSIDKVVSNLFVPMLLSGVEGLSEDAAENVDAGRIYDAFLGLEDATPETKNAAIANIMDTLAAELNITLTAQDRADLGDMLSELYDMTAEENDGKFSMEAAICISASAMVSEGDENAPVYTSYKDLVKAMLDNIGEDRDVGESLQMIVDLMRYFAYAMLFFSCVWFVLFIFAFVHTFVKNKRFMMWYVKLFGGIPCLIFWLLPLLAQSVMSAVFAQLGDADVSSMMNVMFGAISSLTWISGLCYVLLWGVSIFWAFPIKRQIRKLKKTAKLLKKGKRA